MNKCNKQNASLGVVRSRLVGAECARQVSCIFCFPFYPDDFWFGRIGPGRHLALEIGTGFGQVDGRSLGRRCTPFVGRRVVAGCVASVLMTLPVVGAPRPLPRPRPRPLQNTCFNYSTCAGHVRYTFQAFEGDWSKLLVIMF